MGLRPALPAHPVLLGNPKGTRGTDTAAMGVAGGPSVRVFIQPEALL